MRRLPFAGALVAAGGAGLAGLPPFGGFVSEWLILSTLFTGAIVLLGFARATMVLSIATVALTAALALAGAARLIGIGWLGVPRSQAAASVHPLRAAMTVPMAVLAALSLVAGCYPGPFVAALSTAVAGLAPAGGAQLVARLVGPLSTLTGWTLAVGLGLVVARRALATGRPARRALTWDCGYSKPGPSMQYTGSSLSEPLARQLAPVLRTRVRWSGIAGLWPASASWSSQTLDAAVTDFYLPLSTRATGLLGRLRALQEPHVTTHLRYMVLALMAVLALLFLPVRVGP